MTRFERHWWWLVPGLLTILALPPLVAYYVVRLAGYPITAGHAILIGVEVSLAVVFGIGIMWTLWQIAKALDL